MTKKMWPNNPSIIWDFTDEFLVRCPYCRHKAIVTARQHQRDARFSCISCGKSQAWKGNETTVGDATDAYFRYPLWLQEDCCGSILWAYNARHLQFLKDYISAEIRMHSKDEKWGRRNSLLESRLPRWIKSAKNRKELLTSITKLEKLLE